MIPQGGLDFWEKKRAGGERRITSKTVERKSLESGDEWIKHTFVRGEIGK